MIYATKATAERWLFRIHLISQGVAIGVLIDIAAEDQDAFDEAPDRSNTATEAQQNLRDALAGVAQIEIMDAQATQQDAQQTGYQLALGIGVGNGCLGSSKTAVGANSGTGRHRLAAVGAVGQAGALCHAAVQTDGCVGIDGIAAILTIHIHFLLEIGSFISCHSDSWISAEKS